MKFKRIAMLSTHGYFDPIPKLGQTDTGGQVVYVLELAKAFSRLGISVDIFTRWFDPDQLQVDPAPGLPDVRIVRIPCGPWEFMTKEEIYGLLPELSEQMIGFIEKNRLDYDLFHGHYVDAGIVTLEVAKAFSRPSYFTAHSLGAWKKEQMGGDPAEMEEKYNFNHRINEESRIFNRVTGNSVTSSLQLDKLRELYAYGKENVVVIPPGVNIHKFHPPEPGSPALKTGLPGKYIYCLSRIDTNKGHDLLLKAFDRVRKKISDVHLVIGGGSPKPKKRELEIIDMIHTIIKDRGMEEHITFVGYVPEELMVTYYQQARLFVMPSIFEPFGMTTQEAMASGIPVIASRYGGIRTVLTSGKDGLLIDPKNEEEFADAIIYLLENDDARKSMGEAAFTLARDQFSWEVIAERHLSFYEQFS